MRGVGGGPHMEKRKAGVDMEHQMPKSPLLTVGLLVACLISLTLWGCGGSGGSQSGASGTDVSVVFPQQGAMVPEERPSKASAWQHSTPHGSFAGIMSEIVRFYGVNSAYAQVVPSSVSRLLLTITGPGITDAIRAEINPATGRATVNVPVGNARVFEVQAFPSDIPLANFIGRITADVPSGGTNVTINMEAVTLNSIQVTPTNPQIAKGTIQRFTAMGDFSDGAVQDLTSLVDWVSSNTSVAVISNAEQIEGLASGVQEGTTQIIATLINITGETTLTVTAAEVVDIAVTPAIPNVAIGTRLQFVATGIFTDGTSQNLTSSVTWTSSSPAVASITATGRATALTVGTTTISATFQDVTGDTLLTVTPVQLAAITVTPAISSIAVGTRLQFVATGIFTDGSSQDLTNSTTWASSNAGFASITSPGGLATAVAPGSTTISATFQGVTGSATLTVRALELAAITVTPAIPTIAIGTRLQFIATGLFTDGSSQDLTPSATWLSSNPAIATISNAQGGRGLATAMTAGSTTISASFQGITGSATLTVTDAQLAAIIVTPAIPSIAIGTRLQFIATGLFSDGTSQDLTPSATWLASPANVCSIDPSGLATGLAAGTCTISATFQGVTGSATLTVTDAQLAAIIVTPAIPSIAIGTRLQFIATGLFSDGTSQDLTPSATWLASPANVCSIDPSGLATGLAVGTCTISASFQGITGSATLTVTDVILAAIEVTPSISMIADGTTLQFIATGLFSDGTSQDLTPSATWLASPANVCSIDPSGLATGLAVGTCTISASFQGVTGNATLTVTDVILAAIEVTPSISMIADGTTLQFVATGLFTDGTNQPLISGVAWVSSAPAVASISPTGLATAVAPGTTTISATFQGVTGNATLTVTAAILAAVRVTPSISTIADGTTLQFVATGIFTDGTNQPLISGVAWVSSAPAIASISPTGLATAVAPGTTTISAISQGVTGNATLTITLAALAAITVTPSVSTIGDGTTLQFVATGLFTDGTNQPLISGVTWVSSVPAVASISPTGLATAVAPGTTTISAISQGVTGNATLTITASPLVEIVIAPSDPIIAPGDQTQFTAVGIFSDGTTQIITTFVTWESSNQYTATINSQGLATAESFGTTTISATFQGVEGFAILSVEGEGSIIGITKMSARFLSILGTAALTVMLMGLFFRGRPEERPVRRPNRRE
jgi:hypothetical protein